MTREKLITLATELAKEHVDAASACSDELYEHLKQKPSQLSISELALQILENATCDIIPDC